MKKIIVFLILLTLCSSGFSQHRTYLKHSDRYFDTENIYKQAHRKIRVVLNTWHLPYKEGHPEDSIAYKIYLECRRKCAEKIFPDRGSPFWEGCFPENLSRAEWIGQEKPVWTKDTVFQRLFNWLIRIEDFATYHQNDTLKFRIHDEIYYYNAFHTYYEVVCQKTEIQIRWEQPDEGTEDVFPSPPCHTSYILDLESIARIKESILAYSKSHNIIINNR